VVEKKAMKALIILLIVVFSIIFRPTICWAAPPYQEFKNFKDWCVHLDQLPETYSYPKDALSPADILVEYPSPKDAVRKLIQKSGAINCNEAQQRLMQLKELDLSLQELKDIQPIATLTNLEILDLAGNSIKDISPLSHLTNLKKIKFSRE
jgi:Leucine-rich repeat (LRR) protein